jgi:serine/threonine protein kinase
MADKSRGESRSRRPKRRHPDIEVARLLVKKKLVSKEEALLALREQKTRAADKKTRLRLVQVLVKRKVLPASRVAEVQDEIRRHTYICENCDARVVLAPSTTRSESACPRCGERIEVEPPSAPSQLSEQQREYGSARDLSFPGPPGIDKIPDRKRAFGRYEVLEEIGRGAMGVVYRAKHVELGKEIALKILLAGDEAREAQIARFRREAAAVQRLRHDGIVPIHDFGSEGEVYFLTMDLVPGGLTLHRMWKDPKLAPSLVERVRQVAKVALAIDHANERGVIHRDLKPANVLIAPDGTPRVADFGLAKDEEDANALTLSQDRLGTPLFMAPEQVKRGSASVDHRADIWALGVMVFVAVTGRYPFRGRTIMSLYMKILNEEPDWSGESSSSPEREGWGKALPPRELERLQEQDLQETQVASHQGQAVRDRPPVSDRLPVPTPFVPPSELDGKDVPRDLRAIIEMALAKDPDRRYGSAAELARDLERYARGDRVHASPPGAVARLIRRARRRRFTLALVLLAVLVPAALLLGYLASVRARAHAQNLERVVAARKATESVWTQHVGVGVPSFEGYAGAASELAAVCSQFPDQPFPFTQIGLAHVFLLEPDRAREDLARAQSNLEPGKPLEPQFAAVAALDAILRGEDERAATLARSGLAASADDARLAGLLGRALLRLGKADEAEQALAPLLAAPRPPAALLALGAEVALAAGDGKKAAARAKAAHELAGADPYPSAMLGRVALAQGLLDEARDAFRAARESFGANAPQEALYFLDLAKKRRMDRQRRDLKGALDAGALAALLAPWSPVPGFWRADLERKDHHAVAAALREYDECLARDPTFDEVAEIRAELLLARRDEQGLALAESRFRDEMTRVHRERAAIDLATILVGEGKLEEARPLLDGFKSRTLGTRALLLRAMVEDRSGGNGASLRADFDERTERNAAARRRDLIALARARLIAGDAKGAFAALDPFPTGEDPRWAGFARYPDGKEIAHGLRAAALAALGRNGDALHELEFAATRNVTDMAAEATAEVLTVTKEFEKLSADSEFQRLRARKSLD